MSVRQPAQGPITNSPTCTPPGAINPWPIGGSVVCQPMTPDISSPVEGKSKDKGAILSLIIKFTLPPEFVFKKAVTLPLLYVVNGSLDYSALFSQMEVSRSGTITFPEGATEARVSILTLPIPPNSTFELEVLAYAGIAGTIISGPVRVKTEAAEDKSLKALSALATTALVTALGALALALLKPRG